MRWSRQLKRRFGATFATAARSDNPSESWDSPALGFLGNRRVAVPRSQSGDRLPHSTEKAPLPDGPHQLTIPAEQAALLGILRIERHMKGRLGWYRMVAGLVLVLGAGCNPLQFPLG